MMYASSSGEPSAKRSRSAGGTGMPRGHAEDAMRLVNQIGDLLNALVIERGLRVHDGWTRAELALHQRRQLGSLVRHALEHSRVYRELYRGLALGEEIDLQALPVTNKQLMMDHFDSVVTDSRLKLDALRAHLESIRRDEYYLGEYRVLATTGTSGLRGVFVYDRAAWSKVLANTLRWNRFAGIGAGWPAPGSARSGPTIPCMFHTAFRRAPTWASSKCCV